MKIKILFFILFSYSFFYSQNKKELILKSDSLQALVSSLNLKLNIEKSKNDSLFDLNKLNIEKIDSFELLTNKQLNQMNRIYEKMLAINVVADSLKDANRVLSRDLKNITLDGTLTPADTSQFDYKSCDCGALFGDLVAKIDSLIKLYAPRTEIAILQAGFKGEEGDKITFKSLDGVEIESNYWFEFNDANDFKDKFDYIKSAEEGIERINPKHLNKKYKITYVNQHTFYKPLSSWSFGLVILKIEKME